MAAAIRLPLQACFLVLVVYHLTTWLTVQGLLVHIIPHSHCDAGYRKTFDQYFREDVNLTINSVLQALQNDQSKRFVWEEVSYLSAWWKQSSEEQHKLMNKLVQSKQLEFIGGGWVMHDEAVTNAVPVMNQMTIGLDFLNETLGVRPQIGWHIDPFGHSGFTPFLYHAMDYKAFIPNRIPDPIKQDFKQHKHLEFFWYPPYLKDPRPIFAHVLDSHYSTPVILGITVEEKAASFVDTCKERAAWYLTPNLLIPFGNDFAFTDASAQFKEMDEVVDYVNSHSEKFGLTMKYSTLSEYIDTVLQNASLFPTYKGDFLPYVACYPCFSERCNGFFGELTGIPCGLKDAFWTGFYTSKPAQKLLSYNLDEDLRWAEILTAYSYVLPNPPSSTLSTDWSEVLALGRNTSGLMQHHDAITGTSFPGCYEDYNKRLNTAREGLNGLLPAIEVAYLTSVKDGKQHLSLSSKEPGSECVSKHQQASSHSEEMETVLLVANPLPFNRTEIVYADVPKGFCGKIWSSETGVEVPSQVVGDRVYFTAETPALGVSAWTVMQNKDCTRAEKKIHSKIVGGVALTNGVIKVSFDDSGHVQAWTTADGGTHPFSHAYTQYFEKAGLLDLFTVCGGTNVYTFVPDEGSQILTPKTISTRVVAEGPLIWEVEQQINEYINHSIRLFAPVDKTKTDLLSQTVEWQTRIGPLPETVPFSVTSKFGTDILHEDQMTTYSQGYFPMNRVFNASTPFQGNVYPLVLKASINDTKKGLMVSTHRPVGVVGSNGSMEYLAHRRLPLLNDARGNDPSVMQDPVRIGLFSNGADNFSQQADMMSELFVHPMIVLPTSLNKSVTPSWSEASKFELPKGVRVLSMQLRSPLSSTTHNVTIGLRLLNSLSSTPQSVDMAGLFGSAKIQTVSITSPDFHVTKSRCAKTTITVPPLEVISVLISLIH